jgi:hypothetical protein
MKKALLTLHRKRLALLLIATVIVASILLAVLAPEREPAYQGHNLTYWVLDSADHQEQTDALRSMDTNTLPFLVKWACTPTPAWRASIESFCANHPKWFPSSLVDRLRRNTLRQWHSYSAFSLLRTNAYPSLPQLNLIAATQRNGGADLSLSAILYGYPCPSMPTLRNLEEEALRNPNPVVREAATNAHRVILNLMIQ